MGYGDFTNHQIIWLSLFLLLGLGFALWASRRIISLWPERREKKLQKSSFQVKIARAFSIFVAIPCLLLSSFSIFFMNIGMHRWFDRRVQVAVQGAEAIAQQYLKEQQSLIQFSGRTLIQAIQPILAASRNFDSTYIFTPFSQFQPLLRGKLLKILNRHEDLQGVSCMIFSAPTLLLAHKNSAITFTPHILSNHGHWLITLRLKLGDISNANISGLYLRSTQDVQNLFALLPLDRATNTFLLVCRPINRTILERVSDTNKAAKTYKKYIKSQRYWVWISIFIFIVLTLVLIAIAMIGGLSFAQQTLRPIGALIQASEEVRQGQTPLIPSDNFPATSEFRSLIDVFNTMSLEVGTKTKALNQANAHLNDRNLFIESVLEGVSSGVMSLKPDGTIVFFNTMAQTLFAQEGVLGGKNLLDMAKEFRPLFYQALKNSNLVHSDPVTLLRGHHVRTLRLHIQWLEASHTVVVTMDDISTLIAAQKKSAWSDVACRIAHEIKNPLTPIALSAERLRRRYIKEIQNEPEIFQDCIDTIIRQVHHIGNLISEFSDFARLPQPRASDTDLNVILVQMLALHQQAYPNITFQYHSQPLRAHCDGPQIEQVFTNILKNALESLEERKDTPGCITLSVEEKDKWVMIIFQDNGVGLSSDKALLLCEPYQTTKAQGMGLGLAIVQKIIDDHGGLFSIQPALGQRGARVTISLLKQGPNGGAA